MFMHLKYAIVLVLVLLLVPTEDLLARGFGGGGRGGGGGGGRSVSRGGGARGSVSRGGGASRGSISRGGGASAGRAPTATRGGGNAPRPGTPNRGATSRSGAGKKGSNSYTGPRGGSVTIGGAKGGARGESGGAAGKVGGVQVEGPRGRSKTAGGAKGVGRGESGAAAGRAGGTRVEGAGGRTATKGGAAFAGRGEQGAVAGRAGGKNVSGPRGDAARGGAAARGRNITSDAGFSKYKGGVSVRGGADRVNHRTRSVTVNQHHRHGAAVRRSVGVRHTGRGAWFTGGWCDNHPHAWRPGRIAAATVWTAATWNTLNSWWGPSYAASSEPVYYDYGNTIVYEGDTVYNGSEAIASSEEYYEQATDIAAAGGADPGEDEEWMPLGVWAMVQGDQTESNNILQLNVSREGILRGNHYNALTDDTQPIEGSVDKETQRAAWSIGDNQQVVYETGLYNLTQEETEMLIHYGDDRTEQWTLVLLEDPEGGAAAE